MMFRTMRYKHVLQSLALGLLLAFMAACKGGGTDNPPGPTPTPSPAVLDLDKGEVDLGQETSVTFKVKNTGGQELSWSVSNVADLKWLSLSAVSGKVAAGAEFEITISVDKSKLAPGQNQVQVNVTADPGGTKSLTVKAFLAQAPVLAALTSAQIKDLTPNSAKVDGEVTSIGSSNITQHGHLWSLKVDQKLGGADVQSNKLGALSAPKTFTSNITGLKAGTLYYVRAYATNAVNTTYTPDQTFMTGNSLPTAIQLSNAKVPENKPANTVIGTLSTTDADPDDSHTYSLVSGDGSTDNSQFSITGNQLKTNAPFDYETKSSYSIRVKTMDKSGGSFQQKFTITVENVSESPPPTDIKLSNHNILENEPVTTAIGVLTAVDDPGDTHTFTIVDEFNNKKFFRISNNVLLTNFVLDYDERAALAKFNYIDHKAKNNPWIAYGVKIRATDQDGASFEKVLLINILNRNAENVELVDIKGGTYGCNITVSDFKISKRPITNAQYLEFLNYGLANPDGSGDYSGYTTYNPIVCADGTGTRCISLIRLADSDIRHDGSKFVTDKPNAPVTGVTYHGTLGYNNWAIGCVLSTCQIKVKAKMLTEAQLDYILQLKDNGGVEGLHSYSYWAQGKFLRDTYPPCNTKDYRYIDPRKEKFNTEGDVVRSAHHRTFQYQGSSDRKRTLYLVIEK